jgi:hypothetical protein
MKVTKFPKPLTKKYLRLASVYRRFAGRNSGYDFSLQALIDCHAYESRGIKAQKNNGYLFGKWAKDISVATWREDIVAGHFCKIEFHTPCNKWWAEPALESVIVPVWFPFDKNTYKTARKPDPTADDVMTELDKCPKYVIDEEESD